MNRVHALGILHKRQGNLIGKISYEAHKGKTRIEYFNVVLSNEIKGEQNGNFQE